MTYLPLRQSPFWQDLMLRAARFPAARPSKLANILDLLFCAGAEYQWGSGKLHNCRDHGAAARVPAHADTLETLPHGDATTHDLYEKIPVVAEKDYLRHFDAMAPGYRPGALPQLAGFGRERLFTFPAGVDIHYLTGALLLLRPAVENQLLALDRRQNDKQLLDDRDQLVQNYLIGQATNMILDYIVERGLEEDFSASCAEFAAEIPGLAEINPAYSQVLERRFRESVLLAKRLYPGPRP